MTPLMPCPRCTQALPTSAAYCRRCGSPVRAPGARPPLPVATGRGRGGAVLLTIVGLATVNVLLLAMAMHPQRSAPVIVHSGVSVPSIPPGPVVVFPTVPRSALPPVVVRPVAPVDKPVDPPAREARDYPPHGVPNHW